MRGVWRLAALCAAGWLLCGNGCGPGLEPPGSMRATGIPSTDGRTMTPSGQLPGAAGTTGANNPTMVGNMGAAGGGFIATAGTGAPAAGTAGRGGSSAEPDAGVDDAGTP
ncbi:MAG TPA: hypothetical protein VJV78_24600 [Polyangiales bacterium]|nr:hypothetical protein [Polyangiales bacterium]